MFDQVVQIAGIIDQKEAEMLIECGVELLGFPLRLPVNKEDLSEAEAARIIRHLPNPAGAVLITYPDNADEIIDFSEELGVTTVQLHGDIDLQELRILRRKAPGLTMIKSLVIRGNNTAELLQDMERFAPFVDAFITDTYNPETGATGATGKTHDWFIDRELAEQSPKPLILAGGLTPENVFNAIQRVMPDGVDVHTGVEAPDGRKDPEKVRRFVAEARRGFAELPHRQPLEIPINGVLDLHTFSPKEVKDLVPEYLSVCREKGIFSIRIIHGKGTGTLRRIVHSILSQSQIVESYETAGTWGATSVNIRES